MSQYSGQNGVTSRMTCKETAPTDLPLSRVGSMAAPAQTLGSFTPINRGLVNNAASGNAIRARSRGMTGDMLYSIPVVPLSCPPALKKRQRSKASARPKKTPSSSLSHPWRKTIEKEVSQLIKLSELEDIRPKHSYHQTGLFSSASVTKPNLGQRKLITTEDVLKSSSVSLNQTTMEFLTSRRSQPATHVVHDIESPIFVDSIRVMGEEEKAHESRQPTVNHKDKTTDHVDYGNGFPSHDVEKLHTIPACDYLTDYNDHELDRDFVDLHPKNYHGQDPYSEYDTAIMLDRDDHMIVGGEEEVITNQHETTTTIQLDAIDDFSIDDDFENEMAELLVLHNSCDTPIESLSPVLQTKVLRREQAQVQQSYSGTHPLFYDSNIAKSREYNVVSLTDSTLCTGTVTTPSSKLITWPVTNKGQSEPTSNREETQPGTVLPAQRSTAPNSAKEEEDNHSPLKPFARPAFPPKLRDRSPITGLSSALILRTCFRIGEALRQGALCSRARQDAIIELFARVRTSSSDIVTPSKLHFELQDLFHDRAPFIRGVLENNRVTGLQEVESRVLLDVGGGGGGGAAPSPMVRCLGRLKKAGAGPHGWEMNIINIRPADWEEVRWTRQIAGAGMVK